MQKDELIKRYYSQILLDELSIEKQELLSKKSITVIGCGGLGSPLAAYLAGAGVGTIKLVDDDTVELRNLHRQVFFSENDIGIKKVKALSDYLKNLNSNTTTEIYDKKSWELSYDNIKSDLLIDCADNLRTSYDLNKVCSKERAAFLTASIAAHVGQILLFSNDSQHCCLECVFPSEGELDANDCADVGVLGPSVALVSSLQSLIALGYLLEQKSHANHIYRINTKEFLINKNKVLPDSSCKIK